LHERFPDLALVVINHCDPAYLPQAAALGPSCILAGFQEEEPLVALYNAARLVWFPTRYDGFGMPVVEAMASGTTVVSSNTTGIPEVAGDAAVLLSPDEPLTHVEVISELLQDDAKRAAYGRLGRERAERYRWDVAAASLYEAFESLL
jgi:glycosyltransferase involved in cell wall biosynthesis